MTSNIKQEIIDWYNKEVNEHSKVEYFDAAWPEFVEAIWGSGTEELPSGTAKTLDEFGGEGQGDQRWVVFSVGDTIYKVEGYYTSWEGDNWDNAEPYEVEPVEVSVTQYREKKGK